MSKLSQNAYRLVTGISIDQEYVGVSHDLGDQLKIYLTWNQPGVYLEIPRDELVFLGFSPFIVGINKSVLNEYPSVIASGACLSFHEGIFKTDLIWSGYPAANSPGRIAIKLVKTCSIDDQTIYVFEGVKGSYQFLPALYKQIHSIRNYFRNRPGNIKPSSDLYAQLIAAYSIPRYLSVLSTGANGLFNIFPIDLDGYVGQKHFAFSMRLGSKANEAIERIGKVVLARVALSSKQVVFGLGKNHMKELKPESDFDFEKMHTKLFEFLQPRFSTRYIEMELAKNIDHGIHRIHFCKIMNEEVVNEDQPELSLLHRYYAQWRIANGQRTEYL